MINKIINVCFGFLGKCKTALTKMNEHCRIIGIIIFFMIMIYVMTMIIIKIRKNLLQASSQIGQVAEGTQRLLDKFNVSLIMTMMMMMVVMMVVMMIAR